MEIATTILAVGVWVSAVGVLYSYAGYPALIYVLSRLFGRLPQPPTVADADLPRLALLIAAHNEAQVIEARIHNAVSLSYPPDRREIVVASDGSDDGTAEICRRFESRLRVLAFPDRRGKTATLNDAISRLDADIVVLSDANTSMDADALRRLARWFADPRVGAVCGRLVLRDARTGRNADGLYWRYETFLKRCEGRLGGLLGANGAIYAIRRELFVPLPPGTIVDDFAIPLMAKLRSGCRIVYEPDAVAQEETAPDMKGEFRRRSRIGAGGFQAMVLLRPLLNPRYGWTAFTFWSHKVMRWASPFFLIAALLGSALLARHSVYRVALIGQGAFYALCAVGAVWPGSNRAGRLLRLFPMFAAMNLALLIGFLRWLRGNQTGIWARTARAPLGPAATRSETTHAIRHASEETTFRQAA